MGSALPVEHVTRLYDASLWRLVRSVPVNIELQIVASNGGKHTPSPQNNVFQLTAVFGNFPFEAQAPIDWQGVQVPNHATSYAKQLHHDLQALRPHPEGVPDNELAVGELFNDGSTLRLELANFDFATMRHQTLTNERNLPPPDRGNLPRRGLLHRRPLDAGFDIAHPLHTERGPLAERSCRNLLNEPPPELEDPFG